MTSSTNFEERREKALSHVVAILGHPCAFPIEDEIALKEVEDACDRADRKANHSERARIVSEVIESSQTNRFIRRFTALNDTLIPHGRWLSPTYLPIDKVIEIEGACKRMVSVQKTGDQMGSAKCREEAMTLVARAAFHPTVRAFMNLRASRLPHLADVAHYLEASSLLFYRQNYFVVANVLIPAIERLLVSITGFRLSESGGELRTGHYKTALESASMLATQPNLTQRFEAHKAQLVRFLFGRFFERSQTAKARNLYDASLINRAFALHLNEPGSFYTYDDCLTYFQVFDLFTEFIAAQHGQELPGAIPDKDPNVVKRSSIYWELILTDWLSDNASPEKRAMEPTAFYEAESDHNYLALHEGPELKKLLVQAGLAVEGLKRTSNLNGQNVALYHNALTMYYSVVGDTKQSSEAP